MGISLIIESMIEGTQSRRGPKTKYISQIKKRCKRYFFRGAKRYSE